MVPTKILINYLTNAEAREEWVHKKDSLVISQNGLHLHGALLIYFTIVHPSFFPLFPTLAALRSYLLPVYSSHSSHKHFVLDHTSSMSHHLGLPGYLIVKPAGATPRRTRTG